MAAIEYEAFQVGRRGRQRDRYPVRAMHVNDTSPPRYPQGKRDRDEDEDEMTSEELNPKRSRIGPDLVAIFKEIKDTIASALEKCTGNKPGTLASQNEKTSYHKRFDKCHYCSKFGHHRRECRKRLRDMQRNQKSPAEANPQVRDSHSEENWLSERVSY